MLSRRACLSAMQGFLVCQDQIQDQESQDFYLKTKTCVLSSIEAPRDQEDYITASYTMSITFALTRTVYSNNT